ncbi:MAG: exodeoxyribonuclease VII small subunit [Betaproteobacteria bacterium]|jgi:exodeoxyribonuclease VII small subunit|nr:exodeoxyribonuclease VII small subunit [Betaproteobacteria bacterium]MCC6248240.1 exodeoxyribonuclease VII small subunit [Rubrivivax sp.]
MARSTAAAPAAPAERTDDRPGRPASYEQALAELDHLVLQMEQGELPLDRLLDDYRRGAELLAYCRGRLEAVEAQVKLLEEGRLKPWNGA